MYAVTELVKIHLGDQSDAKPLLGTYVCTDVPGEFRWQPGALAQVGGREVVQCYHWGDYRVVRERTIIMLMIIIVIIINIQHYNIKVAVIIDITIAVCKGEKQARTRIPNTKVVSHYLSGGVTGAVGCSGGY